MGRHKENKMLNVGRLIRLKFMGQHGLTGLIALGSGATISLCAAIYGDTRLLHTSFIYVYMVSMAVNAIAAYMIIGGDNLAKLSYKVAIVTQLCLACLTFRLRPASFHLTTYLPVLRIMDFAVAMTAFVSVSASFYIAVIMLLNRRILAVGPVAGVVVLFLLSIHALQLTNGGDDWLDCVAEQYPAQREALIVFVYIPISLMIMLSFIGVTLLRRRIISHSLAVIATFIISTASVCFVNNYQLILPCDFTTDELKPE